MMAHVELEINERKYHIACDNGQEEHLKKLGDYIENRVQKLVASIGQVGDSRLLVMVSLLIADELSESDSAINTLRGEDGAVAHLKDEENLSLTIESLAERIERVAESLSAT